MEKGREGDRAAAKRAVKVRSGVTRAAFALLAAAALAGCPSASAPPFDIGHSDGGCALGCQRCAPEAGCLDGPPYQAACYPRCGSDDDCGDRSCVIALVPDAASDGGQKRAAPLCLTPRELTLCGAAPQCTKLAPFCFSSTVLARPLAYTDTLCGWELIACDSGCDAARAQCT